MQVRIETDLDEVTHGTRVTGRTGVAVRDTSHGQKLGRGGASNKAGTTGGGHEADTDGTALASELAWDGVGLAEGGSPVATADRDDGGLGKSDGATDGVGDFARALDTKADVAVVVADGNEGLEAGTLTSGRLLLDGHDLEDFIVESVGSQDGVDDFGLLDGEGEKVDILQGGDELLLDEAAELGDGGPLLLLATATTATATSASATASTTTAAETALSTETTAASLGLLGDFAALRRVSVNVCVSHCENRRK